MYLDPPYDQHRYSTNYHVWEPLVRWDESEHYGVACKRVDARDERTGSVFDRKHAMPPALRDLMVRARAEMLVVSYNDESWMTPDAMTRSASTDPPGSRAQGGGGHTSPPPGVPLPRGSTGPGAACG